VKKISIFSALVYLLLFEIFLAFFMVGSERLTFTGLLISEELEHDTRQVANVRVFGAKGDGEVDDTKAIQSAIDHAITNRMTKVFFPAGRYRITDTIKAGYGDNQYISISIEGLPSFLGYVELKADFTDRPAINIQGARSVRIKGLRITGKNIAPEKAVQDMAAKNTIATNIGDWVSPGCSNKRHSPYAGITIDAYSGKSPRDAYPNDPYNRSHSSAVIIEDVTISYFVVGIAVKPSDNDENAENIKIKDSTIIHNTFAVSVGGTQQRNVALENVAIAGSYVAITTFRHGRQNGQFPFVYNCTFGLSFRLFEATGDLGAVNIDKVDAESFAEIGLFGEGVSSVTSPATISNSNLYSYRFDNYKPSRYVATFTILKFSSCNFYTYEGLFNMVADGNGSITLENSSFLDLTKAPNRFVNSQLYGEYRLNVQRSVLSFDPPLKAISDTHKTRVVPKRLSISPTTYEIIESATGKRFQIKRPSHHVSVAISDIALSSSSISFKTDYPEKFQVGDYLYWQAHYSPSGRSFDYVEFLRDFLFGFFEARERPMLKYTWLLPVLRVSAVDGNMITSKLLATDIDTSYTPSSVDILRANFVNNIIATGNLAKASNRITNVSSIDNFQVGDWIFGRGIPDDARIKNIDERTNSIDMNYDASLSATGVEIYNSLLKEIR